MLYTVKNCQFNSHFILFSLIALIAAFVHVPPIFNTVIVMLQLL